MIRLAAIIEQFMPALRQQHSLLPSHYRAINAIRSCRSSLSPKMQVACTGCDQVTFVPHSCGHRSCPHCQHHEGQRWIERQCAKQVPVDYFMLTFTLPAQFRPLAWHHQRLVYQLMFACIWDTLRTFSVNDKKLNGIPGAVAVLHTHSRKLDYHPHLHVVMPAAAIDPVKRLWRQKSGRYLFHHQALATVFRAKLLAAIVKAGLSLPEQYPEQWVVDCKQVGSGDKALIYLGRYLYRGVIAEKDILSVKDGKVTFRYVESKTGKTKTRTESGADFLWLVLQHILPRGFRRARDFGFLQVNSKSLIRVLHWVFRFNPGQWLKQIKPRPAFICSCCGAMMKIVRTRIKARLLYQGTGVT